MLCIGCMTRRISQESSDATEKAVQGALLGQQQLLELFVWHNLPALRSRSFSLTNLFFSSTLSNDAAGGGTEPHRNKAVSVRASLDLHGDGIVPFQNKYRKVSF